MKYIYDERPIIACSTGKYANTAISVVRLSGFLDLLEYQPVFEFDLTKIRPRFSHLTKILFKSIVVDQIIVVYYPKSSSFNGENILELHLHGNLLNIDRIISYFVSSFNIREAQPGEFSYRAYKNKKLSLSQVEGLDLFLNAQNPLALDQGLELLQGNLHETYLRLYDLFLKISSSIELLIDFSEDIGEEEARKLYFGHMNEFKTIVSGLSLRCGSIGASVLNPEIVIVGETNAGKSTFFNALLNTNRAIVSSIKGTTRDYITEHISFEGVGYNLIDTAGIRETVDEIEKIGISRSFEKIKNAFYKILIINPNEIDHDALLNFDNIKFDLIIFSHADVSSTRKKILDLDFKFLSNTDFFLVDFSSGSIGPDRNSGSIGPDEISGSIGPNGKSGSIGPDRNSGSIGPLVLSKVSAEFNKLMQKSPILLERHRNKINDLHVFMVSNDFNDLDDIAILSNNINGLGLKLSELIGQITPDDVLNSIFSNFCIGK